MIVASGRGAAVFAVVVVEDGRVGARSPLVPVRQVVRRVQRADRRYNPTPKLHPTFHFLTIVIGSLETEYTHTQSAAILPAENVQQLVHLSEGRICFKNFTICTPDRLILEKIHYKHWHSVIPPHMEILDMFEKLPGTLVLNYRKRRTARNAEERNVEITHSGRGRSCCGVRSRTPGSRRSRRRALRGLLRSPLRVLQSLVFQNNNSHFTAFICSSFQRTVFE